MSITYETFIAGRHPTIGRIAARRDYVVAFSRVEYGATYAEDVEHLYFQDGDRMFYWTGGRTTEFDAPRRVWQAVQSIPSDAQYIGTYPRPDAHRMK